MKNIPIGEVLKEYGYINDEQLNQALAAQKEDRSKRLGQHLIDLGFITEEQMLTALSDKLHYQVVKISEMTVDLDAVKQIPQSLAEKYSIIAVRQNGDNLIIVTNDPLNFYGIEDVRLVTGKNLEVELDTKDDVTHAISYYYKEVEAHFVAEKANREVKPVKTINNLDTFDAQSDDTPIVQLLNSLLIRGYNNAASDIHIEPFENEILVRMRIDGMITDYMKLNKNLQDTLTVRVKIMSNLNIAEKRLPQDGHFVGMVEGQEINVRVSIIPTIFGEKIVLRYLNSNVPITNAGTYGMNQINYQKMKHMMESPHGIIYITGPTGSGKTTTLYMILQELAKRQVNISTIEDPVERNLARINQMQVNVQAGLTFETGLRALMRQDPDIIMVGETRDAETASISVRAAITGHLVLSTLHTNDAISTVVRLEDMGIEPYLLANSVVGAVAQRLVRTICPHCKEEVAATDLDRELLGPDVKTVYKGKGCNQCNNTGYKGRIAVHEVVILDAHVRKMVADRADISEIKEYIREHQKFQSLKECTADLVKKGVTTIDELQRVAYYDDE